MTNDPVMGDRLGWRDLIIAASVGFVFFFVYLFWSTPGLDPSLWNEAAVAAGVRPPQTIFPGYWRQIARPFFTNGDLTTAARGLGLLGSVLGAFTVSFVYLIIRHFLSFLSRYRSTEIWRRIAPAFALMATLCFAAGDPMWRMIQPLTPGGLRFFLVTGAVALAFRWYVRGGYVRLFLLMTLLGLIAAETVFGFLLALLILVGYHLYAKAVINAEIFSENEEDEGASLKEFFDLPKWRMFFLFVLGFALGAWLNVSAYIASGGVEANGLGGFDLLSCYAMAYWRMVFSASTPIGWVLTLALSVFPFVGVVVLAPRLARDSNPMPFGLGILMLFAALLSLLQTGVFPMMRVWEFAEGSISVRSDLLMALFALCSVLTAAIASSLLAHECHMVYDMGDDDDFVVVGTRGPVMRGIVPVLFALLIIPVFLRIPHPVEAEMRRIVHDALVETVRECGDAKFIFTDGRLDAGLELVARAMKSPLLTLDMMSGGGAYDKYLRQRGFETNDPDREQAGMGASVLLRIWAGERENGMDSSALQLGFEFWKRARKPVPTASGLVAREKGMSADEVTRGIASAKAIAERLIDVAKKGDGGASSALKGALSSVSWRISRFARLRDDDELADLLDEWNETVKKMMRLVEYERMRTFMQLTPYEGMRLALRRADFIEARRFAATVLQIDANDAEANFGTGMAYLMEEKLKDAEFYLERCLTARPEEPAVMNNLSIIYRKTGRLDKALEFARKASEALPGNEEVADTLKEAEKAIQSAAE